MSLILDIASILCFVIGTVALITGSLGLLRLPDVYSRIHAAGIIDTAGVGFIVFEPRSCLRRHCPQKVRRGRQTRQRKEGEEAGVHLNRAQISQ